MPDTRLRELPERYSPGFIQCIDRRTDLFRRLQGAYDNIVDDCGGEDALSRVQLSLIERFVFLEAIIQTWEVQITTDPIKHDQLLSRWIQAVNALQGLCRAFGLHRVQRRVIDLQTYLQEQGQSA